jgi:hypothetical protein
VCTDLSGYVVRCLRTGHWLRFQVLTHGALITLSSAYALGTDYVVKCLRT